MPALNSYGAWRAKEAVSKWSADQVLWFCIAVWNGRITLSDTELVSYPYSWYPGDVVAKDILQDPIAKARLLGHSILDEIQHHAFKPRSLAGVNAKLVALCNFLIWWFLPDERLSIRTCPFLEILLAVCMSGKALAWLSANSKTRHGRAILRVLPQQEAEAVLLSCSMKSSAWNQLVNKQRFLCDTCEAGLFGLYQFFSDSWRYVGMGSWNRPSAPGQPGLVKRLWEHLFAAYRPKHPEAGKLRYRLCRSTPVSRVFFLICRTGTESVIRALETLEIRTHEPQANGRSSLTSLGGVKGKRRRPPQRVRQMSKNKIVCLDSACFMPQMQKLIQQPPRGIEVPADPVEITTMDMPFSQAYRTVQLRWFAEYNLVGPLWIADPRLWQLLLSYAALANAFLPWQPLERAWNSKAVPFLLHEASQHMQSKSRQRRVAHHCDTWLRARGLPTTRIVAVKVAHKELVPWVRGRIRAALQVSKVGSLQGSDLQVARSWLIKQVRIHVVRPRMWSDSWTASSFARKAKLPEPTAVPRKGPVECVRQSWHVEKRQCPDSLLQAALAQTRQELKSKGVSVPAFSTKPVQSGPVKAWKQHWQHTQDRYDLYTQAFFIPRGCLAVPDDKCKKHAWIVTCAFYACLLANFACAAPSWKVSSLSPAEAESWCKITILRVLGPALFRKLNLLNATKLLPSTFMTFKAKCWTNGFRTCAKKSHSCMRKIVSYASWPKKHVWRSAHRALDTIIKTHGQTRDVWSLHDASFKLNEGLQALKQGRKSFECCRCFRKKPSTVGIAADAGQFYEVIDASIAVQRLSFILQRFAGVDSPKVVVVERTRKRQAWFSVSPWNIPSGAIAWTPGDLFRMFCAAMFISFTRVGDKVFRLSGLPIGGFLSKIAASAVLGCDERIWCNSRVKRESQGFRSPVWEDEVVHLRYIDDIILISSLYCCTCLQYSLKCIYSVDFDIEASGSLIPWLDCAANCEDYCVDVLSKQIFPPPPWAAGRLYLKSLLLGKFSRWLQMNASEVSWKRALLALFRDLKSQGWKRKQLHGGLKCIGRLEFQKFVSVGLILVRHVLFGPPTGAHDDKWGGAGMSGRPADEGTAVPSSAASPSFPPASSL